MIGIDEDDECALEICKICKENINEHELNASHLNSCVFKNNELENILNRENNNYKHIFHEGNNLLNQSYGKNNLNQVKCKIYFKKANQDKKYLDNKFTDKGKKRTINKNGKKIKENENLKKKENRYKKKEAEEREGKKKNFKKEEEKEKKGEKKREEEMEKKKEINEQKEISETEENTVIEENDVYDSEKVKNKFDVFHMGINRIESIKALYRDCKKNFNKSFKDKISKLNSLIYFYTYNNFENNFSFSYHNDIDKINSIKNERVSRLFLYIEDISKLKQALRAKQNSTMELEDNEKKEYFYDANEDIEDFFIFDDSISYLNNDVDSIFTERENVSILKEDKINDNFLEEVKSDESYMLKLLTRFSLKNYYCFDINKNLCYMYDCTPMIFKKFVEKINSYSIIRSDKVLNNIEENNINFTLDCKNNDKFNYNSHYAIDDSYNLENYVQYHCDKWQENIYDIVEVNSLEFDLKFLKCNIM